MKVNVATGELSEARPPRLAFRALQHTDTGGKTLCNKHNPNLEEVHPVTFSQVLQRYFMVIL